MRTMFQIGRKNRNENFWSDTNAVSAVEFAFILPLLLLIFLGTNYTYARALAQRKLQVASYSVVNMAPWPRDVCSTRAFYAEIQTNQLRRQVLSEIMRPFPVSNQAALISIFEKDGPSGLRNFYADLVYDFRISSNEFPFFSMINDLGGTAPNLFRLSVRSPEMSSSTIIATGC